MNLYPYMPGPYQATPAYAMPYNNTPYRMPMQNGGCGCGANGMHGLGELTDAEVQKMCEEYFKSLPASIFANMGLEAVDGKYDTAVSVVKELVKKICTAGAVDQMSTFSKWALPALIGVGLVAAVWIAR